MIEKMKKGHEKYEDDDYSNSHLELFLINFHYLDFFNFCNCTQYRIHLDNCFFLIPS